MLVQQVSVYPVAGSSSKFSFFVGASFDIDHFAHARSSTPTTGSFLRIITNNYTFFLRVAFLPLNANGLVVERDDDVVT